MGDGWIKIHRRLMEWEHFKEPSVVTVYLALLLSADRDGKTEINLGGLTVATKLSKGTVKKAITKLVRSGEITREKSGSRITTSITKWSDYQLGQKLNPKQSSLGQKLNQYRAKKQTNTENDKAKNCTDIGTKIEPTTHYLNNKNKQEYNYPPPPPKARARAREKLEAELLADGRVEIALMQYRITEDEYRKFMDEILADWEFRNLGEEEYTLSHFSSVLRIVVNKYKRQNNGTNENRTGGYYHSGEEGREQRAAAVAARIARLAAEDDARAEGVRKP